MTSVSVRWMRLVAVIAVIAWISSSHASEQTEKWRVLLRSPNSNNEQQLDDINGATMVVHRRLATSTEETTEKVGQKVRDKVISLRGGNDKFYHDLINATQIMLCYQTVKSKGNTPDSPKNRFVDPTDPNAYKDDDGNCVQIADTGKLDDTVKQEYAQGQCEVKPNCYWGPIEPGDTDRRAVYDENAAVPPVDGAMTYAEAKETMTKWVQGILIFLVPGIVLAVISLLTMIFFLMCRCCCNRCGGRAPKEGGYTCLQKFLPVLFYLLFSVAVVIVAGVSLLYQKTFTNALADIFDVTVDTLTNTTTWIDSIQDPMTDIAISVMTSAGHVEHQLGNSGFIDDGVDGLISRLNTFASHTADVKLPNNCVKTDADPLCFPCDVCTTINTNVNKATTQINDQARDGVNKIIDVRSNLLDLLVDIADSVQSQVNNAVTMSDTMIEQVDKAKTKVQDVKDKFDAQKSAQKAGVLVLFALCLLVIALGLIGVLFGLTPLKCMANIIHIAYFIGFIALLITFIVSAIFLAVSVVLGDACEMTDIIKQDWTVVFGDEAVGVNSCFQDNVTLIEAFNLTSKLEFADIQFPDLGNVSSMLDFSQLNSFSADINKADISTFSIDNSALVKVLTTMNTYTGQNDNSKCQLADTYTLANIKTPWLDVAATPTAGQTALDFIQTRYQKYDNDCVNTGGAKPLLFQCQAQTCSFSIFVGELYTKVSTLNNKLTAIKTDAGKFVDTMHNDMKSVTDFTDTFKLNTTQLYGNITAIQADLSKSLINDVDLIKERMTCRFLGDSFDVIYDKLCGKMMPSFTMISFMLFLAGIFLFPVVICLIIAVKRLKARGNGSHVMDNDDTELK